MAGEAVVDAVSEIRVAIEGVPRFAGRRGVDDDEVGSDEPRQAVGRRWVGAVLRRGLDEPTAGDTGR